LTARRGGAGGKPPSRRPLFAFARASLSATERESIQQALALLFADPRRDSRAPDIIVIPSAGVIYTKPSASKIAEHGGFSRDETAVALLVSAPSLKPAQLRTPVTTAEIAPTVLLALGLNPQALLAVRQEHTTGLPGLGY